MAFRSLLILLTVLLTFFTCEAQVKSAGNEFEQGNAHFDAGRYKEAIAAYTAGLAYDSLTQEVYNNRGLAYMKLQNYKAALMDFDQVLIMDAGYKDGFKNRAIAHLKL